MEKRTNRTKLETITKRLQLLGRHIAHVVLLGTAGGGRFLDQFVVLHFAPHHITHFQFLHDQLQRFLAAHKHFIQTKLVQRREGEAFLHASSLARNQQQHLQVVRCQRGQHVLNARRRNAATPHLLPSPQPVALRHLRGVHLLVEVRLVRRGVVTHELVV